MLGALGPFEMLLSIGSYHTFQTSFLTTEGEIIEEDIARYDVKRNDSQGVGRKGGTCFT
jgi:hypothetical protein